MTSTLTPSESQRTGWAGALSALPKAAVPLTVAAAVFGACLLAGVPGAWLGGAEDGEAAVAAAAEESEAPELSPAATAKDRRARARCDSCGVLVAIRKIGPVGGAPAAYEFTVRLRDGTFQTRRSASAGNWRSGDRIMLLGGSKAPDAIQN